MIAKISRHFDPTFVKESRSDMNDAIRNGNARPVRGEPRKKSLTNREREVLGLIVLGWTDGKIANALYVSRNTVSNHVVHILSKLEVPNRTAAAALAVLHDLGVDDASSAA